jgi:hypothetical protein
MTLQERSKEEHDAQKQIILNRDSWFLCCMSVFYTQSNELQSPLEVTSFLKVTKGLHSKLLFALREKKSHLIALECISNQQKSITYDVFARIFLEEKRGPFDCTLKYCSCSFVSLRDESWKRLERFNLDFLYHSNQKERHLLSQRCKNPWRNVNTRNSFVYKVLHNDASFSGFFVIVLCVWVTCFMQQPSR